MGIKHFYVNFTRKLFFMKFDFEDTMVKKIFIVDLGIDLVVQRELES